MTSPQAAAPARKRRLASPKPLGKLLPLLRPHAARLVVAAVCLVLAAAAGLVFPTVVRWLLDAAFTQRSAHDLDRIALGLLGVFAAQGVLNFVQVYLLSATASSRCARSSAVALRASPPSAPTTCSPASSVYNATGGA